MRQATLAIVSIPSTEMKIKIFTQYLIAGARFQINVDYLLCVSSDTSNRLSLVECRPELPAQHFTYDTTNKAIVSLSGLCLDSAVGETLGLTKCDPSSKSQAWIWEHQYSQRLRLAKDEEICVAKPGGKALSVAGSSLSVSTEIRKCARVSLEAVSVSSTSSSLVSGSVVGGVAASMNMTTEDPNLLVTQQATDILAEIEHSFSFQGSANENKSLNLTFYTNCTSPWNALYRFACKNEKGRRTRYTKELGPVSVMNMQGPKIMISTTDKNACTRIPDYRIVIERKRPGDQEFVDITSAVLGLDMTAYMADENSALSYQTPGFWDRTGLDKECDKS